MVDGLNKLVISIIVVFSITSIILLAEIIHILRRRYQNKNPANYCWWRKRQSRIEPNEIRSGGDDDSEVEEDEEEKWRKLFGTSRVLFTIKEEEEEAEELRTESMESDSRSFVVSDDVIKILIDDDSTPFATPCGSPPYYTPSPSPVRVPEPASF